MAVHVGELSFNLVVAMKERPPTNEQLLGGSTKQKTENVREKGSWGRAVAARMRLADERADKQIEIAVWKTNGISDIYIYYYIYSIANSHLTLSSQSVHPGEPATSSAEKVKQKTIQSK